jgi:hypothetical protein
MSDIAINKTSLTKIADETLNFTENIGLAEYSAFLQPTSWLVS